MLQSTNIGLQCRIPTTQIWAITQIITSTLTLIVLSCVLYQCCGYWLLSDAFANAINFYVKLTNERLELKIHMIFILVFKFDAKKFLLASRIRLEVTHVLAPFFDCLHQFDPKTIHMMLVLMFDPIFKINIYTLNNYVGIEKNHNCNNKV